MGEQRRHPRRAEHHLRRVVHPHATSLDPGCGLQVPTDRSRRLGAHETLSHRHAALLDLIGDPEVARKSGSGSAQHPEHETPRVLRPSPGPHVQLAHEHVRASTALVGLIGQVSQDVGDNSCCGAGHAPYMHASEGISGWVQSSAMRWCVIPARGGSKRIPRKNIRPFCGQPIIARSIAAALESGLFDGVVVSTDDDEIAEVATAAGASVPFRRSTALADDHTPTNPVVADAVAQLRALGHRVDTVCCLYADGPVRDRRRSGPGTRGLGGQRRRLLLRGDLVRLPGPAGPGA